MQKIERKELLKNIVLLAIVFFICFVFFEVILRLTWQIPGYGYPEGLRIIDETKGYKHSPNFVDNFLGNTYKDIEIKINSRGLRDYEHSYERDNDTFRILGLGDSVTFGSGVEYGDSYLRQLEDKFSENDYNVEIIKAGVGGYEFDQQYTYFFEEGYKYKPNVVMIGIVLNDAKPVNISAIQESYSINKKSSFNVIKSFIGNFFTYRYAYISLENIYRKILFNGKDYNQVYFEKVYDLWRGKYWEFYKTKLLDLNLYLKENKIELVLVIFPYTQQFEHSLNYGREPQTKIISLSKSNNITVIDLTTYLDLKNFEGYYLVDDNVHLNAKGYKLVKEIIYSELVNGKLVKNNVKK